MRVADYVCQALHQAGVSDVFVVTGGGAMHLNDALQQSPLNAICTHHEQGASVAAEGYARAGERLAAAMVTTGPGGTNAITGVMGAFMDSVPLFVVSGQVKRETCLSSLANPTLRQLGDQEVDIVSMVAGVTKAAVHLKDPEQARYEVERLIHLALTGRKGPVWLDIPVDVQGTQIDPELQQGFVAPPPQVVDNSASIERVAAMLRKAQRPLLVAGQGVRLAGAQSELFELLASEELPFCSTLLGFDLVPSTHPCHIGRIGTIGDRAGNFALQNADFVLFVGTRNNIRQTGYGFKTFARSAFKVVVDIDAAELSKPTVVPDLPLCMDARAFLDELLRVLKNDGASPPHSRGDWLSFCRERKLKYPVVLPEYEQASTPVNPYVFCRELVQAAPDDAIFVTANATACIALFQAGQLRPGQRVIWNSGSASMGYGLPAAIGAAVATGRPVICLEGEGSLMMNLQELETLRCLGSPVHLFILDNQGYISIRQTQNNFFNGRLIGTDATSGVTFPPSDRIAHAFRLPYTSLTNQNELKQQLHQVLAAPAPQVVGVLLPSDYQFSPKASSEKKPDGRMVSKPLEDMAPFLPRDEFLSNLLVPPLAED